MSITDFPRFHFRGFARVNVPTANRNTHGQIDIATNTVLNADGPVDANLPPSEFHQYLKRLEPRFNAAGKREAEGIFSEAVGYNASGNNHFSWENVQISGVQLQEGEIDEADALVGARLALWGHYNEYLRTTFNRARWVDNHPGQADSTLIYAGQITISNQQASPEALLLLSADIPQSHSVRWVGNGHVTERDGHFLDEEFGRSRLFQFSVAKHDPNFQICQDTSLPASLRALQHALSDEDVLGLTIQYALFNMSTPQQPNSPVFYDLVGSIGLWRRDELGTYPAGRLLMPRQNSMGPLVLKVHGHHVTLNMPTAIPFTSRAASAMSDQHPTHALGGKHAMGDLLLYDDSSVLVARIPEHLYLDYWRNHGVIDVALLHPVSTATSLHLQCAQAQWDEVDWLLQFDSNQLYLEAPNRQRRQNFPQTITLQSRLRGELQGHPGIEVQAQDSGLLELQVQPSYRGMGFVDLSITGCRPGATRIKLGEGAGAQYLGVRVLPDDWHLDEVPAEQVDYNFLYRHVLSYYELVYPFMSEKVFSFADHCKCETYARLMWQMCDPQNREKSYYMPSTRELSLPKSRLFLKYLSQVEDGAKVSVVEPLQTSVIRSKAELIDELKKAIDMELSLMLQYLYAAYTIPNYQQGKKLVDAACWSEEELELAAGEADRRRNSGTRGTLLEVAHEEMIHYLTVNNVLMALGQPFYAGTPLCGSQAAERFGLDSDFSFEPFSEHVLAKFVRFEWPSYLPVPGKTIGAYYIAIRQALAELPDLFDGLGEKRGGEHHLFLTELTNRLHPAYQLEVYDRDSALFAIDFVTEQGEGVAVESPHFSSSHFQRLRALSGRYAVRERPFEPAVPALKNPVLTARPECTVVTDPAARSLMFLYDGCYQLTLNLIAHHFAQCPPGSLRRSRLMNASIDIMTGLLRPLAASLMNMPSGVPGRNAGPPVPDRLITRISSEYSLGCQQLALTCQEQANFARDLKPGMVSGTLIEMLEFYCRELSAMSLGTLSREA